MTELICLSHLRWGFVFQRPNHLMSRAARDRRTFFWEEPVVDESLAPGDARLAVRHVAENLQVVVPTVSANLSAHDLARVQKDLLDELVTTRGMSRPALWFYTPMALEFARHLPARVVVYDCMDELSAFRGAPQALREREEELFARADLVFTGGMSLYEAKRGRHPSVHAFPSSVDADHFARARDPKIAVPADQADDVPRPRVGYFGVIDERIDLDLVAAIADAKPSWHVVMVGPVVKIDPATLPRRPNLHYLGQKSYDELPAYLAGWDVAMMPFALNEATRFISPTKTLEYLAAGKPVVSTAIRDVVQPYGESGLVHIAGRSTFASAIDAARASWPERMPSADAFVATTSWDQTWGRMSELLDTVAPPHAHKEANRESLEEEGSKACTTI